ncbi:MAG TPA: ATP-binding protein [Candidatus Angelobacter sp.]|nr:ATP-binding protein [Candidatus Angelobacter sp.]
MERSSAPGVGRRLFSLIALTLFLLHAALLLAARSWSVTPLLSDSLQFFCALLAAVSCLYASRRMEGFGKQFWLLISAGFFIWSAAQLLVTYYEDIVRAPLHAPWPSDIVFFISMAPAFLALFIDSEHGFQWKDWPRIFDVLQVVIFTAACYLFAFQAIEDWRNGWGAFGRLAWVPDSSRDAVLLIAYISSSLLARRKLARHLYRHMAVFFFLYLGGEIPYLYLQSTTNLRTGSLWDLTWSLPFVAATFLSAGADPVEEEPQPAALWPKKKGWGQWGVLHVVSLAFPLVVLLMAAGIAEKQLFLAIVLVVASFACSLARIVVGEQQQRHAALELEERNALLRSVFEGTGDAIYVKDLEGRYLMVNERVAGFYGKTKEEVIGKTPEQLTDAALARQLTKDDRRVIETGQGVTVEFELPGEPKRTLLVTRNPYLDASGKISGIMGIGREVTEHRLMEERLRQSQKMEAIGTLAGGVAHDFNNILMVISGYGSVLNEALASDPKLRAHVEQIQKAAERAASLTRQLLAFSRKQAIQPTPLNLNSVVTSIEKLLHRLIGEHITISTRLDSKLGTILADPGQIEQVILNLAINARDAMPDGGRLTLETRNTQIQDSTTAPKNLKPGPHVELVVSDTGVGMSLEVQARIFEPFFTTKPLGKGTGLGLSTVYGIVEQANGHITFTSQPGGGTTFRVYLPRVDSALAPGDTSKLEQVTLDGSETVLLVEDDQAVCDLVRAVLISHGYSVLSARRPQEAEMLCEERRGSIDLLLSDVVMPEMNGAELSERLQKKNPKMKVLFMSGYIDEAVVHQGIQEKKLAFLQKPFSPLSLARKVREVLDGQPVL